MQPENAPLVMLIAIWIVIGIIVVTSMLLRHLRRRETEKTIRVAMSGVKTSMRSSSGNC